MNIKEALAFLDQEVPNPSRGLPDDIFYYISRTTPLVNVDLLIRDECGRTLLAWRDDPHCGTGWHIPGGIVRFKETLEDRLKKVAEKEIGAAVAFEKVPLAVNQCIHAGREIRGHFISLLYRGSLPGDFVPENTGLSRGDAGYLQWHDVCPGNLLKCQDMYRKYLACGGEGCS